MIRAQHTHKVQLHIPHSVHPQVQAEGDVRAAEEGCRNDTEEAVRDEGDRADGRNCGTRSCAYVRIDTAKGKRGWGDGVSEGEEHAYAVRLAPRVQGEG